VPSTRCSSCLPAGNQVERRAARRSRYLYLQEVEYNPVSNFLANSMEGVTTCGGEHHSVTPSVSQCY
jgi:hypothetical protein